MVQRSVSLAVQGAGLSLVFLFVYLFVFSLVGMQVFGARMFFVDGYPNSNFDTWWDAWLTCFTVRMKADHSFTNDEPMLPHPLHINTLPPPAIAPLP